MLGIDAPDNIYQRACIPYGRSVYCIGGSYVVVNGTDIASRVDVVSPITDTIHQGTPLPQPIDGTQGAVTNDGRMIVRFAVTSQLMGNSYYRRAVAHRMVIYLRTYA